MALQNLGEPPSRPNDYADLTYLANTYPFSNARIQSNTDYTIAMPTSPLDHAMYLLEVIAGPTGILVTVPGTVLLTVGLSYTYALPPTKVAFFGFRYSSAAGAWFILSASTQA